MQKPTAHQLLPHAQQAWIFARPYKLVIANLPCMCCEFQTPEIKKYLEDRFQGYEKVLFSAFSIRNRQPAKKGGKVRKMTASV